MDLQNRALLIEQWLDVRVIIANSWLQRLKGLLGYSLAEQECLWLYPCRDIHTIGMGYSLDLLCLDHHFRIVDTVYDVRPYRFYWGRRKKVYSIIEFRVGTLEQRDKIQWDW